MDGATDKELQVIRLSDERLEEAVQVLVDAFSKEETTTYHLDTSRESALRAMEGLFRIFVRLLQEAGSPVFIAAVEGRVVGVGILRDPRLRISKKSAARLFLPELARLAAAYGRRPVRSLRITVFSRPPKGLEKPFLTFEALGVQSGYRGRGAGSALMRKAQEMARCDPSLSGIYLNTGSEKNRSLYQGLGYEILKVEELGEMRLYHMFWKNPGYRSGSAPSAERRGA